MLWRRNTDLVDPLERAYRRYFKRVVILGVQLAVVAGLMYGAGVPHVQWTYTMTGQRPSHGWVHGRQKLDAWYLGPFGWQHVENGQYGQVGCPVVTLIPLEDCLEK